MTVNAWLWIGAVAMAIGAAAQLAIGWNPRTRDVENHYLLHLFVCLAALASYLVMATGDGAIHLPDGGPNGRDFYFARYVDWSITTPMLLLGLGLTAMHSPFRRWAALLGVLFADMYMIVTGLFAGLSPVASGQKWLWYIVSCGAFALSTSASGGYSGMKRRRPARRRRASSGRTRQSCRLFGCFIP